MVCHIAACNIYLLKFVQNTMLVQKVWESLTPNFFTYSNLFEIITCK